MNFWYYAFWYLLIGVLMDFCLSTRTKPSLWSIFLWPFIWITALFIMVAALFKSRD